MQLNLSISLWNYIHYFPLRKGGTSFFLDRGLDSLARVIDEIAAADGCMIVSRMASPILAVHALMLCI